MKTINTLLMIVMLYTSCSQHYVSHARHYKHRAAKVDYERALINSIEH